MNESIFMNNPIETDLSRPDDGYDKLLDRIRLSFNKMVDDKTQLFTTDVENLYDIFLDNLPEEARQHYRCNACRNFVNRYGGLVTIDESGVTFPIMWCNPAPQFFKHAVHAVRRAVENAKVTGVFMTSEKILGTPKTRDRKNNCVWQHMAVETPKSMIYHSRVYSVEQKMGGKKEDYRMLMRAVGKYCISTVETAVNLLRSNSLYRSGKILGIAEWFLELKRHNADRRFHNIVWRAVATAPAGFCHISGSVIGSLLDDIEDGYDFDAVKRRFDEKMNPVKYQRPQTAPGAQNIARAEKIVAELGLANSLKRRFARMDEVQMLWSPTIDISGKKSGGVFSNIKAKDTIEIKPITGKGTTMTWAKFQRMVLPRANKIEFKVSYGKDSYAAFVTAEDPDAPPIIAWDTEDNRNPFSWYMYSGGSYCHDWNLGSGAFVNVTGIALQPNMWQDGYDHMGEGVMFFLENCKDKNNKTSALFPKVLRGELHEVRATIEAYSKQNPLSGDWDANACGILHQSSNENWQCTIRVTTDVGVSLYTLDRWD